MFQTVVKNSLKGVAITDFAIDLGCDLGDATAEMLPPDVSNCKFALACAAGIVFAFPITSVATNIIFDGIDSIFDGH